jgi:hypothetical protein
MEINSVTKRYLIHRLQSEYPKWINPELKVLAICQTAESVYLEMTFDSDPKAVTLDIGFIEREDDEDDDEEWDEEDEMDNLPPLFNSKSDVRTNAEIFIRLRPYTLVNCVDRLFTIAAKEEVIKQHEEVIKQHEKIRKYHKPSIPLRHILKEIGFQERNGNLYYRFKTFTLDAYESMFPPVISFLGRYYSSREAGIVDFQLPNYVESFEAGVNMLVDKLRLTPGTEPDWYLKAKEIEEEKRRQAQLKYQNAPKAFIEQEIYRMMFKKIDQFKKDAPENDITYISFDGFVLKIVCAGKVVATAASGDKWDIEYQVSTGDFPDLPKRVKRQDQLIIIWDESFRFGPVSMPLI